MTVSRRLTVTVLFCLLGLAAAGHAAANADGTDVSLPAGTQLFPTGGPLSQRGGHTAVYGAATNRKIMVVQLKFPKAETGANFQKYTTLVVKDFESTVGDVPPVRVRQDLPGTVIARLNECYPGAFEKITREASGSAEEFVVNGTITEYNEGSRFARFMLGAYGGGSAKLVADVSLTDGTGRELARTEGRWVSSPVGGGLGALVEIEQLVLTAGGEIADRIAEKRGVKMAEKCSELEKAQRER